MSTAQTSTGTKAETTTALTTITTTAVTTRKTRTRRTTTTTMKPTTRRPNSNPCYPNKHNKYFAVIGDCHKFIVCVYGSQYTFPCPRNTVYYPDRNFCGNNNGTIKC